MIKGYIEYEKLESIVMDKLKSLGITENDYPLNPFELIVHEGICLREIDYDSPDIRGMIVFGKNGTGISINQNRTQKSKNFIAMHELQHYWLHPRHVGYICIDDYIDVNSDKEWQANNAAAISLMPANLTKRIYCECNGNINYISDYFNVSPCTVGYRLQKILNVKQVDTKVINLVDQISKRYFSVNGTV